MTAPEYEAIRTAGRHGYLTALADNDTEDWSRPGSQAIVEKAMPTDGKGAIILMHDGGGNRKQTIEALRILIPRLQQEGYAFATVSAATDMANPVVKASTGQRLRGEAFLLAAQGSEYVITFLTWALIAVGLLTIVRMGVLVVAACYHARTRRRRRWRPEVLMPVSVIVPAYNEAAGIARMYVHWWTLNIRWSRSLWSTTARPTRRRMRSPDSGFPVFGSSGSPIEGSPRLFRPGSRKRGRT
jgi:hypothetical protein